MIHVGTVTDYGQRWGIYIKAACGLRRSPCFKSNIINTTDLRTNYEYYYNTDIHNSGLPSAADANKYFYLPALGACYDSGVLKSVGYFGKYWSSTADSWGGYNAYYLKFSTDGVYVERYPLDYGFRAEAFQ